MADPEAALTADPQAEADGGRPKVVVIVTPRAESAAVVVSDEEPPAVSTPATEEASAQGEPAASGARRREVEQADTATVPRPKAKSDKCLYCQDVLGGAAKVCSGCSSGYHEECWVDLAGCMIADCCEAKSSLYVLSAPTRPAPTRPRTPADEELVGAVIQLDLAADPCPLTDFLGRSLLFRAARAASEVYAPRLILIGNIPPEQRDEVYREAYEGFRGGVVEITGEDPSPVSFGKGRVLLLDGSALHDPEAVGRLARVRGERTALLLGQHGDGSRVATRDGLITEVGADISPYDGVIAGACSVPVEEFELLTRLGYKAAMRKLAQSERLIGTVVSETYSRQFRSAERIRRAQVECFAALATSGNEGVFEDLIGRPISRLFSLRFLHVPSITPNAISVAAGILAMLAAGLLALGHAGAAVAAAFLAILSAILDRTDGELARLRLVEERRSLDFGLDHVTHALLFLGLAYGVQQPASGVGGWEVTRGLLPSPALRAFFETHSVSALTLGFMAAGGVLLLMAVMLWRGEPSPNSQGLRRLGDSIASYFGSRDYFYLLLIVALLNLVPSLSLTYGVMGWFLLGTAALVHASWVLLLIVSLLAPKRG